MVAFDLSAINEMIFLFLISTEHATKLTAALCNLRITPVWPFKFYPACETGLKYFLTTTLMA